MAKQIYSFTKIEKKKTNAGVIAAIMGIAAILALLGLIVAAAVMKGEVPFWLAGCGLLSLVIAAGGFVMARSVRKNDDAFGRFLDAGYLICGISLGLHLLVFLIGILAIIM